MEWNWAVCQSRLLGLGRDSGLLFGLASVWLATLKKEPREELALRSRLFACPAFATTLLWQLDNNKLAKEKKKKRKKQNCYRSSTEDDEDESCVLAVELPLRNQRRRSKTNLIYSYNQRTFRPNNQPESGEVSCPLRFESIGKFAKQVLISIISALMFHLLVMELVDDRNQ